MPHQVAVTVKADIRPGQVSALKKWLAEVDSGGRRVELFPFERLPVHFARLIVLDDDVDLDGAPIPASVAFLSDVDAPVDRYLDELCEIAAPGLDGAFGHCEGYPTAPYPRARAEWLQARMIQSSAVYVNTVGRSVEQVRAERRLRDAIEEFLDEGGRNWSGATADDVRSAVRRHVVSDPDLSWAKRRARRPEWRWRLREAAHLLGIGAAGLLLLPALLLVVPLWLLAIRLNELRDVPSTGPPDPARVDELTRAEDRIVQNQFSAVGYLKPGWLRRVTVVSVLFGIDVASRHLFNRGSLAGIKTIHFARWTFIDDSRRLLFTSNYDGSLESYMDDFIDKVAWSLNAAFSNGVGYPRTRWLIGGGARDEEAFKNYIRNRQVPTQLWYSAYPDLTALNIGANARLRAGLRGSMAAERAEEWARLL
ncbi:MAG: hypothetical protein M3179_03530 [Actinomycetota bacterium]|nr:hypothetical protein [Actinomycetota bacterium]